MFMDSNTRLQDRSKATEPEGKRDHAEGWVIAFRSVGTLPPLFCACAGGGDAFDYHDLALALPADQPVYAFGMPPLRADAAFPTVQQLAAIYVSEVRKRQPHGPYRLCGHSFGGVVVYEMAVLLAKGGEEVSLVALIDTLHPAFKRNMSARERVHFQLSYAADRIAKYIGNLVNGRIDQIARNAFDFVRYRSKHVVWKIARSVFGQLGRPAPIRSDELVLVAAWNRYEPARYAGRLVLLNAADRPPEYQGDSTLGWRRYATGAIDIHVVPGDHDSVMHLPYVRTLVERIEPYLTRP
jgi:thioesterase domain-containing protein